MLASVTNLCSHCGRVSMHPFSHTFHSRFAFRRKTTFIRHCDSRVSSGHCCIQIFAACNASSIILMHSGPFFFHQYKFRYTWQKHLPSTLFENHTMQMSPSSKTHLFLHSRNLCNLYTISLLQQWDCTDYASSAPFADKSCSRRLHLLNERWSTLVLHLHKTASNNQLSCDLTALKKTGQVRYALLKPVFKKQRRNVSCRIAILILKSPSSSSIAYYIRTRVTPQSC